MTYRKPTEVCCGFWCDKYRCKSICEQTLVIPVFPFCWFLFLCIKIDEWEGIMILIGDQINRHHLFSNLRSKKFGIQLSGWHSLQANEFWTSHREWMCLKVCGVIGIDMAPSWLESCSFFTSLLSELSATFKNIGCFKFSKTLLKAAVNHRNLAHLEIVSIMLICFV